MTMFTCNCFVFVWIMILTIVLIAKWPDNRHNQNNFQLLEQQIAQLVQFDMLQLISPCETNDSACVYERMEILTRLQMQIEASLIDHSSSDTTRQKGE